MTMKPCKRRYAQGTALGEFGILPMCDQADDETVKVPSDDLAHEIWAAAQTAPGEGIEDAVIRITRVIAPLQAEVEELRAEVGALRKALGRILENEASDWKAAEEFGGYVLTDELREEARALLARYGAKPVTRTEPSSGLGTIEYSVRAPETTKAFSDPAVRAAWTLGPVSDTQPKRRPYNVSGSLSEYGVFPECDAAPAAMRKEGEP